MTSTRESRPLRLAKNLQSCVISPIIIAFVALGTMIRVPVPRNSVSAPWATHVRGRQVLMPTASVKRIAESNLARNNFGRSGVPWLDNQAAWSYTMMPCMQGKFRKLVELLRQHECDGVLEVGGPNPLDQFEDFKLGYINVEPMAALQLYEGSGGAH